MRILLVEDDPFFQKFYAYKLAEKGFTVDVGRDGLEGLALMQKNIPDLILLDLIMPNMDGFGVLSAKAQNPQLKAIPVLVFSTLSQEQDVQKALSLGALDYANKSFFDFETLTAKIANILSNKK